MADVIVGRVDDFPVGTARVVTVQNRRIAVFRTRTGFYGLRDVCPHQGAALSRGTLLTSVQASSPGCYDYRADREYIRCPWHGWEYELATGRSAFDPRGNRVASYPASVVAGGELESTAGGSGSPPAGAALTGETYPVVIDDEYVVLRA
jgi:nitrite reductase/ring-hydroxylating ferredoxin subunit